MTPFDANKILEEVQEKIAALNLPVPPKPKGEDTEIKLPDDPDKLSSTELARKYSEASAWQAYVVRLIGILEAELVLLESEYKIRMNVLGIPIREKLGKVNKEVIEAYVLNENDEIMPLYNRINELTSIKATLDSRMEIYGIFKNTLSREQSRRAAEMRVG